MNWVAISWTGRPVHEMEDSMNQEEQLVRLKEVGPWSSHPVTGKKPNDDLVQGHLLYIEKFDNKKFQIQPE